MSVRNRRCTENKVRNTTSPSIIEPNTPLVGGRTGDEMQKREKLSVRIPFLVEVVAEGRWAVVAASAAVLVLLVGWL
jgi:hypothetical protein